MNLILCGNSYYYVFNSVNFITILTQIKERLKDFDLTHFDNFISVLLEFFVIFLVILEPKVDSKRKKII